MPRGIKAGTNHAINWKGGRVIEPRGYVLIYVGKDHPLADCRGYAYEHRLKARARKGQLIHHDNERKGDNRRRNLIKTTRRLHRTLHRKSDSKLRKPGEPNLIVKCACGCGAKFRRYDENGMGRPRHYISGHNPIASPTVDVILKILKTSPSHRSRLQNISRLSMQAVAVCLSKLKKKGLVENYAIGMWRLCGKTR